MRIGDWSSDVCSSDLPHVVQSGWIGKPLAAYGIIMQRLAIYDMDRTITHAPTWTPFLWGTMRRHAPWRMILVPAAVFAAFGYPARVIERARLKQTMQRLLPGGSLAPEAVEAAAEDRKSTSLNSRH